MQLVSISQETKELLAQLDDKYVYVSEMAASEREFLTELILQYNPKKILEVGVAAGASSVLMLNAIKNNPDVEFHSVDYRTEYYRDANKKTGFIVDEYPELKDRRKFYSGDFVSKFLDEIGGDIDFCLIDTMHCLPGELLDFIMILPYLKENAVVVLHDTNLHTFIQDCQYVNNMLLSVISGKKLILEEHEDKFYHNVLNVVYNLPFANIGAVVINKKIQIERIWDVFNLLTQRWNYLPTPEDLCEFRRFIKANYDLYYCQFFEKILTYQKTKYFSAKGFVAPKKPAAPQVKAPAAQKKVVINEKEDRAIRLAKKRIQNPYQYYDDARFAPLRLLKYFYSKDNKSKNLKREERAIKLAIKRIQNPYQYYADAKFPPLRLLRFFYKKKK